jgi:hypothetical protein
MTHLTDKSFVEGEIPRLGGFCGLGLRFARKYQTFRLLAAAPVGLKRVVLAPRGRMDSERLRFAARTRDAICGDVRCARGAGIVKPGDPRRAEWVACRERNAA